MSIKIAILPGDGIGPEIIQAALHVLDSLQLPFEYRHALVGGAAYEKHGNPLPAETLAVADWADAVLFGAVGDWKYDNLAPELRPEQAILGLRKHLKLFANFRPARLFPALIGASTLKPEIIDGLDILIIRELTGDIYFGTPCGIRSSPDGEFKDAQEGFDTMRYSRPEIERIAHRAFIAARGRQKKLTSVDKANVLATSRLWREVMNEVATKYPDVTLSHLYVDNAAMQLVRAPKDFDVIVTGNLFGDILSDLSAMLTGSIGMLASASLNHNGKGLYEPAHGSAPDIAGKNIANPLATILSAAAMLEYSLGQASAARRLEQAISSVLAQGLRTRDIATTGGSKGEKVLSCSDMGVAVKQVIMAQSQ